MNDFVSKVEDSVRPRHLGLGFVWAWIYCSFSTSALFAGRAGSSINADSSWFASAVAVVGCFFVFALAWRRVDMLRMRPAAFVGTVLMAVGTFFLGAFGLPAWVGTLCGVASGVGSGLLVLFWAMFIPASKPSVLRLRFPRHRERCSRARSYFPIFRACRVCAAFRRCLFFQWFAFI